MEIFLPAGFRVLPLYAPIHEDTFQLYQTAGDGSMHI